MTAKQRNRIAAGETANHPTATLRRRMRSKVLKTRWVRTFAYAELLRRRHGC